MEFVDDVRHFYLDDSGTGPAIEYLVSFLSFCPELARMEHNFHFYIFWCLSLGLIVPNLPAVDLGSGRIGTVDVDLFCVIEPH